MKIRMLLMVLVMLTVPKPASAQVVHWTGNVTFEVDGGLGYHLPVVDFTQKLEVTLNPRVVIDANASYSYAHKLVLNNGYELSQGGGAIFFIKPWFGINPTFEHTLLATSAYRKDNWTLSPGVVFRAYPIGIPSRITLNGIIPSGRKIDPVTGIENNEESGVRFGWTAYMGSPGPVDSYMAFGMGFFHGYDQGNPICDGTYGPATCGHRTSWLTGNATFSFEFRFPKVKDPNLYW
jgi:hypothetical protein